MSEVNFSVRSLDPYLKNQIESLVVNDTEIRLGETVSLDPLVALGLAEQPLQLRLIVEEANRLGGQVSEMRVREKDLETQHKMADDLLTTATELLDTASRLDDRYVNVVEAARILAISKEIKANEAELLRPEIDQEEDIYSPEDIDEALVSEIITAFKPIVQAVESAALNVPAIVISADDFCTCRDEGLERIDGMNSVIIEYRIWLPKMRDFLACSHLLLERKRHVLQRAHQLLDDQGGLLEEVIALRLKELTEWKQKVEEATNV